MRGSDLKKSLLFLAAILVVVLALDRGLGALMGYLHRNALVGESGGQINAYLQLPERPALTIMGNSRTVYTLVPDSLPVTSFNLSHNGMDLSFQAPLMHLLAEQGKLGKTVILLIDPEDFLYAKTDHHSTSDAQHLKHYYRSDSLVTQYVNRISRFEEFKMLFHLYRYNGAALKLAQFFVKTKRGAAIGNGYTELAPTPRDSINTTHHAQQLQTQDYGHNLSPITIGFLEDIVQIARQSNTQLIFFTAPYYFETSEKFAPSYRYLDNYLAAQQIPWFDYSRIPLPELQNPHYWKDAVHPNVLGARIITHDLVKRMQQQGLMPKQTDL